MVIRKKIRVISKNYFQNKSGVTTVNRQKRRILRTLANDMKII